MHDFVERYISNKSLPADVDIRIRRRIVEIPVRDTIVRAIVPVPTKMGKRALYNPTFYILKYKT